MERVVGQICSVTIELDTAKCELDAKIAEVRERYEKTLSDCGEQLEKLMGVAEEWAAENREEFGKNKSLEMTHGVVGYRTGNPTLKTIKGFTWDRVIERLEAGNMAGFIRTKKEVDKATLLSMSDSLADLFPKLGIQMAQTESFFVDPKREMEGVRVSTLVA